MAGLDARLLQARDNAAAVVQENAGIVFLAIPDQAVSTYSETLRETVKATGTAFVHLSGALPLGALDALRSCGAAVGSFHPLQSFAAAREPDAFRGIMIAVDASDDALAQRLEQIATALGARARRVTDEQRPLYHAAAVMASNYLVALAAESMEALEAAGWSSSEAIDDVLPLMAGTLANLGRSESAAEALTGPIRRGDAATVERNLAALDAESPDAASAYRILGLAALRIAQAAGLTDEAAAEIRMALTRDEQRPGGAM